MPAPRLPRTSEQMRTDALEIWLAGVRAVNGRKLVTEQLQVDQQWLGIPEHDIWIDLENIERIFVAGAGKAARSMAAGVAEVLQPLSASRQLCGHIQVPASTEFNSAGEDLRGVIDIRHRVTDVSEGDWKLPAWLERFEVRPATVNSATELAVQRTQELCRKLAALGPQDLCLFVLSGGASALLTWPIEGVSVDEKNWVTQFLASAGVPIEEMNIVRSALSRVKAGGLARCCSAGRLVTLILSDVLGDPLLSIGSGPTYTGAPLSQDLAIQALAILEAHDPLRKCIPGNIYDQLQNQREQPATNSLRPRPADEMVVLGNTALAVDAAGIEAERRGYSHAMHVQPMQGDGLAPTAEEEGSRMAEMLSRMNCESGPDCLITGGETVVDMSGATPESRGGRNQHLALAALEHWIRTDDPSFSAGQICFLSGGTDGEDGNTPVAGACLTADTASKTKASNLDIQEHLRCKNSYHYFRGLGGLLLTGNTDTNVCDLRVGIVSRAD